MIGKDLRKKDLKSNMPITSTTASETILTITDADGIQTGSKDMKQTVERLQKIENQMETIGENIRKEGQVYRAELEERQRLGLHGEAAIKHYNEWMKKYGMEHLMVKED